jgi:hypothetical protein
MQRMQESEIYKHRWRDFRDPPPYEALENLCTLRLSALEAGARVFKSSTHTEWRYTPSRTR